jgi:hypothetical protein
MTPGRRKQVQIRVFTFDGKTQNAQRKTQNGKLKTENAKRTTQ